MLLPFHQKTTSPGQSSGSQTVGSGALDSRVYHKAPRFLVHLQEALFPTIYRWYCGDSNLKALLNSW